MQQQFVYLGYSLLACLYLGLVNADEDPEFVDAPYQFWVGADVPIGTSVGQIRVSGDVVQESLIYDLLHSYIEGVPFAIEERQGVITVVDSTQNYPRSVYEFEAVATDDHHTLVVTNVTVHVVHNSEDQTTSRPMITRSDVTFRVRENISSGALVTQLGNVVNDSETMSGRVYTLLTDSDEIITERFAVSPDGTIYTLQSLDREERAQYRLSVLAEDPRVTANHIYQVTVLVEDENDNPPLLSRSTYEGRVAENSPPGTLVSIWPQPISATDADENANADFSYSLQGNQSDLFSLDPHSGILTVNSPLDREFKDKYKLRVLAKDRGELTSEANVTINIDDENDNWPSIVSVQIFEDALLSNLSSSILEQLPISSSYIVSNDFMNNNTNISAASGKSITIFSSQQNHTLNIDSPVIIEVSETIPNSSRLIGLKAIDKDAGINATISYRLVGSWGRIEDQNLENSNRYFNVDTNTGILYAINPLPPGGKFWLELEAIDGGQLTDNFVLGLIISDVNNHAPVFTKQNYRYEVSENDYSNHILGRVEAHDADFGDNGLVSYKLIDEEKNNMPLSVGEIDGRLSLSGHLDRETRTSYHFTVEAKDNGRSSLKSYATIELVIRDVNDNKPHFKEYTRLSEDGQTPIYESTVREDAAPGTPVIKVNAHDADLISNGNGLVVYSLQHRSFSIDPRSGRIAVTNDAYLDAQMEPFIEIFITASDLGESPQSSTALLRVTVLPSPNGTKSVSLRRPVFSHRVFELQVEENEQVPFVLITLNVTEIYKGRRLRYSIVQEPESDIFSIDPWNGTLYLLQSLDREKQKEYQVTIRAESAKKTRGLTMVYPPPAETLAKLAVNEVRVVVKVRDVNDNAPRFIGTSAGRPIIAAAPSDASYGYSIIQLQAVDIDESINGEVRYQILARAAEDVSALEHFAIDPISGQVRSLLPLANKVYGFDVKATDRKGAQDGLSAIVNVLVYVLDELQPVGLSVTSIPVRVEAVIANVTQMLQNVTGLDVRVLKLQPAHSQLPFHKISTNILIYAVDSTLNTIINKKILYSILNSRRLELWRRLDALDLPAISLLDGANIVSREEIDVQPNQLNSVNRNRLPEHRPFQFSGTLEMVVIIIGSVSFFAILAVAICIACIRQSLNRKEKQIQPEPGKVFPTFTMNSCYPGFLEPLRSAETSDTYVDMHSAASSATGLPSSNPISSSTLGRRLHHHESYRNRAGRQHRHSRMQRRLMTEACPDGLNGSGAEHGRCCKYGLSSSHSSDGSTNGSYDDSLKSLHSREVDVTEIGGRRKSRRKKSQTQPAVLPPPQLLVTPSLNRRVSERVIICPVIS